VSELKRAEQRMSVLNESFVRIASHDLGHHARSIGFGLEKLAIALGPEPPDAAVEQFDRLRSKVTSMAALLQRIGDVGELSRQLRRSEVPLGELLEGAVEARDDVLAARGAKVEWPADLPTIDCDPVLMRTVLMNLIVNAVTHNDGPEPRVTIEVATGPPLEVRVGDNGPGIPPAAQASVFEPFSSNDAGGSGLGLTIARQVVELHGGTLTLDVDHGPGACFVIRLP
jgi:signal transduction histidine kinase